MRSGAFWQNHAAEVSIPTKAAPAKEYCQTRFSDSCLSEIRSADAAIAIAKAGRIGSKYRNCSLENSQKAYITPTIPERIFNSTGSSNFQSAHINNGSPIKNATPR